MAGASRYAINSPEFRRLNPQLGGADPNRYFQEAMPTQAEDYDEIMQGYRDLMGGSDPFKSLISKYNSALGSAENQFKPVSYQEAPEFAQAFAKAQEYANTGGLSEQEQGSLRARAVSPIRAIYANMTRNMDRQRRLSGGFSPNYNATASRMARESSGMIADQITDANAAIAEMVQKGRLAMTPEMAKLAQSKNSLMNEVALQNQANQAKYGDNQAQLLAGLRAATEGSVNRKSDALRGMTSLYGTNPALVETYGKLTQNQQQINNAKTENRRKNRFSMNGLALRG